MSHKFARARKKHLMAQLRDDNEFVMAQNAKLLEAYERAWIDRETMLSELLSLTKTVPLETDLKPLVDRVIRDASEIVKAVGQSPPLPHPDEFKPKEDEEDAV